MLQNLLFMSIHFTAVIDPKAVIHDGAIVGPYCVVGEGVTLERGVRLMSHVVIEGNTVLREGVQVYPLATLGAPPQHFGYKDEPTRLIIGEHTHIREHVTIHRGTEQGGGITSVGSSCMIMVGCHIGHDGRIGDRVTMANNVLLGGHVEVENDVVFGGMSAVHQMTSIGRGAMVAGYSALGGHVMPYTIAIGNRAKLSGLNLHRLKKQNVSSKEIHALKDFYRYVFIENNQSSIDFRIYNVPQELAQFHIVQEAIKFLTTRDKNRPICMPEKEILHQNVLKMEL